MITRTYSHLITLPTFRDRYEYLKLGGVVGESTFGFQRWVNQQLYHSGKWRSFKDDIVIRDDGCDLAMEGFNIRESIVIHHLNPITYEDIINQNPIVFDPENVVCTRHSTHNAIHYGDESLLIVAPIERTKNDTCPWRQ